MTLFIEGHSLGFICMCHNATIIIFFAIFLSSSVTSPISISFPSLLKETARTFKKAKEFHSVSGSRVGMLLVSPTGIPYTHASPSSSSFNAIVNEFLQTREASPSANPPSAINSTSNVTGDGETSIFNDTFERINKAVDETESEEDLLLMKAKLQKLRDRVEMNLFARSLCLGT